MDPDNIAPRQLVQVVDTGDCWDGLLGFVEEVSQESRSAIVYFPYRERECMNMGAKDLNFYPLEALLQLRKDDGLHEFNIKDLEIYEFW